VAFFPFDLRHHPYFRYVLRQFHLGSLDINNKKLADTAELPSHKLADAPDLSGNRVRLGTEELPGDFVQFLLAAVYGRNESWVVVASDQI